MGGLQEEFRNGFQPLIACVIGTSCGLLSITFYTQGIFYFYVAEEFGWTRAQFFTGFTVMLLTGLITAPVLGSWLEKYDAKKVGILGLIGHAIGYIVLSRNPGSLPLWYISFALLAVIAAGSLPITWTTIINTWFVRNRGLAIGFTMGGTGLAAALAPNYTQHLIDGYGWRSAYALLGVTALTISLPIVFFFLKTKDGPREQRKPAVHNWGGSRREALSTYRFWALGIALILVTISIVGFAPNFVPLLLDEGFNSGDAAGIVGYMGVSVIVGRLGTGFLIDRVWSPAVAAVAFSLPAVAMILITMIELNQNAATLVAIFVGLSLGAELDIMAYLTSRYFGTAHYGSIFGAIFVFFTVGAGAAGVIWGFGRDIANTYTPMLQMGAAALGFAVILILSLGKYPDIVQTYKVPTQATRDSDSSR